MSSPSDPDSIDGPIAVAGGGRIGQALGRLLFDHGEPVVGVACRSPEHAAQAAEFIGAGVVAATYSDLPSMAARILITVSDDAIAQVAQTLALAGMKAGMALHTSGVHGPDALQPLAEQGVSCATLHPLQTVPSREQGLTALRGIFFAVTGGGSAAVWTERIASILGGRTLRIAAEARPLYHCAAVMASNFIVTLIDAARKLAEQAGVPDCDALPAIAPLVEASVRNALSVGPERALTGPIRRGDRMTVAAHLSALQPAAPSIRELYRAAAGHTIQLARRAGLDEIRVHELEDLLSKAGE